MLAPQALRDRLIAELDAYRPFDAREAAMRDDVRAFVAANPRCFDAALAAGHVTGSAWIVDRERTAAVLLHHRKLGRWLQPGGHADGDGDVRRVARREAEEETGLRRLTLAPHRIYDIDVHEIPARGDAPAHRHYDVRFRFVADRDEPLIGNAESRDLAWVDLADLEAYDIDDSVRRLAAKSALA